MIYFRVKNNIFDLTVYDKIYIDRAEFGNNSVIMGRRRDNQTEEALMYGNSDELSLTLDKMLKILLNA